MGDAVQRHRSIGERSDWRRFRHDDDLTGRSAATGRIRRPSVVARADAGSAGDYGREGELRVVSVDLNRDGIDELLSHEGGRLVCRHQDGTPLWRSSDSGVELLGIHDVAGAGTEMQLLVVHAERTLKLLSGSDGSVLWTRRFDDPAICLNQQNVRAGKMLPDIRGEQITIWPEGDDYAYLYAFDRGPDKGRLVWKTRGIGKGEMTRYRANVLASAPEMGPGSDEVDIIVVEHSVIWACRATDGERRWELAGPKMRNYGFAGLFDVDNDGRRELVLVNTNVQLHLSVIRIDGRSADYVWDLDLGMTDFVMSATNCPVDDVDGDGNLEIYYSIASLTQNEWLVEVRDPVTSALKRRSASCGALDAFDYDGDGVREILVEDPVRGGQWLERADGAADRSSSPPGGIPPTPRVRAELDHFSRLDRTQKPFWSRKIYRPVTSDGAGGAGSGVAVDTGSPGITEAPRRNFPSSTPLVADLDNDGLSEILFGRAAYRLSDGALTRVWSADRTAEDVMTVRELNVGTSVLGNWSRPLFVADVDGDGCAEVLLSRGLSRVALVDHRGAVIWETKVKGDFYGGGVYECVAGHFRDRDRMDICVNAFAADQYRNELVLLDGRTGAEIWRRRDGHDSGLGPVDGYLGIRQLEHDGLDDLLFLSGDVILGLDGARGTDLIPRRTPSEILRTRWVGSGSLVFLDVDGDGNDEVFLSGVWGVDAGVLRWNGTTMECGWHRYYGNESNIQSPPRWRHQGVAHGPAGVRFGGQSLDYRFSAYDAGSGEKVWSVDIQSAATGEIVTADIDGDGVDEFIFGTSDGRLMCVGYSGEMRFVLDLDAPVGNPVIADVDADGELEIVVATGDGALYVIDDTKAAVSGPRRRAPRR